jgi:polysaccharide deacetylase 2 family uncharacterized protein YibQ
MFAALAAFGFFILKNETRPETPKFVLTFSQPVYTDAAYDDTEDDNELENLRAAMPLELSRNTAPKIAVIINDVGLNQNLNDIINKSLGENISLAFSPYSRNLDNAITAAQNDNKDTYIKLITSSENYLIEDTGPKALNLEANSDSDITLLNGLLNAIDRIDGFIIDGYVGPEKKAGLEKILSMFSQRHLILIDATDNETINSINVNGLQKIRADIVIDDDINRENLQVLISTAEIIAKEKGQVVMVVNPKPINILMLVEWINAISNNEVESVSFVPISTLMVR